jgi:hypothetical protein
MEKRDLSFAVHHKIDFRKGLEKALAYPAGKR